MGKKAKRIDAYIAKSGKFSQPILRHLRELVHKGCPDVVETVKWGMPSFEYKGILCGFASFKQHCTFGFWKHSLLKDPKGLLESENRTAMGHLGRMTSMADLPSDSVILGFIRQAAKLNEAGMKVKRSARPPKKPLRIPPVLSKALAKNAKSRATFENFNPSNKREYVEWIAEAKSEDTRKKRLATAIDWMAAGKVRNWKYVR